MFLVRLALRNPYFVLVLGVATVVLGATVLDRIPVDLLPQFKTPAVQVVTLYPGMPAETIERDMSTRLQRWTGQSVGIEHQEAKSMLGVSIVKDFFHEDVDANSAMSQVTSYAMSDLYYLPPGTVPPMVMPFDPTASVPMCLFSVDSTKFTETELYDIAYFQLRNRLQSIPGVIAPAVYGGRLRSILVYLDHQKLQGRSLSPMDAVASIQRDNVFIPTGSARFGPTEYQLESNAMVPQPKDLDDFAVKLDGFSPVLMKDVGRAEDTSLLQTNIVRVTSKGQPGKRQLYVPIYRQPGANTIRVVNGVRDAVPDLKTRLPEGINMEVVFDQSQFVREAIRNLASEGLIGAVLAGIMVIIFLRSFRSTFFVMLTLPLSVMAAIIAIYFMNHSINVMTLGGLAIVVGLLIDQSIVVLENIERHLGMGKEPEQAALDGGLEVARPVLVIVITTCVVFFPAIFLFGIGKFLFTPLALVVTCALIASYVMAVTIVPVCAAKFLKARKEHHEGWFEKFRGGYSRTLDWAFRNRWGVFIGVGVIFVLSLGLYFRIGTELFPDTDTGQLLIRVRATSGSKVDETEKKLVQVEETIQEVIGKDYIQKMITNIGVLNDWPAAYTPNSGPHDAFVLVQLTDQAPKKESALIPELRGKLTEKFAGVEFSFEPNNMLKAAITYGLPAPINIQVQGNDLQVSYKIAEEIKRRIKEIPGTADVRIQQRLDYPQYRMTINRRKIAEMGLDTNNVVQNITTAFNSSVSFAKSFWIDEGNGNHYWIGAQYPESAFEDLETLKNVPITSGKSGQPILLRDVVEIERTTAPSEVMHYNINRVIDVFSRVEGRDLGAVAGEVEKNLRDIETEKDEKGKPKYVPSGYTILRRGEVQTMKQSFGSLGFGLGLAAILVYLVLVVQFRSLRDPFIIMFAVPLGLIGVLWMLFLTGTRINIQSLMGVITMVGIVKSFSLLMIDFANRRTQEGKSRQEAILEAASVRFRPILMTALAAVLGLVPMALVGGANIPLARAVIGGVLASTVLILYVVPLLYGSFGKKREATA